MAKGWQDIEAQTNALAEQRERFAAGFKPMLRVNNRNPGPFVIRFLEQGPDVNNYPVHEYKVPNPQVQGGFANRQFTCLSEAGQECPGCAAGLKVKRRGVFNVIQRQRPVFRKDKDGKAIYTNGQPIIDGYQDEVVIVNVGGPTAEMLRKMDGKFQGLMSRDFEVSYSADQQLAANKHDLDEFMKPPPFQEAAQLVAQYGNNSGARPPAGAPPTGGPQGQPAAAGAPPQNSFLQGADLPPGAVQNTFGGAAGPPAAQPVGEPVPAPAAAPPAAPAPTQG
jgi:hypothetical protein